QETTKGSELEEGSTSVLLQLAQQLRDQIEELRKQGDKAKEQLNKTVLSFSSFLDDLAKQDKLSTETLLFLSQSYASLDQHGKAAALLQKIPEPKGAGDKPPEAKLVTQYHGSRLLYARQLRLDKKYAQADAALKEIRKTDWGKNNLDVRKEEILILEDQERF